MKIIFTGSETPTARVVHPRHNSLGTCRVVPVRQLSADKVTPPHKMQRTLALHFVPPSGTVPPQPLVQTYSSGWSVLMDPTHFALSLQKLIYLVLNRCMIPSLAFSGVTVTPMLESNLFARPTSSHIACINGSWTPSFKILMKLANFSVTITCCSAGTSSCTSSFYHRDRNLQYPYPNSKPLFQRPSALMPPSIVVNAYSLAFPQVEREEKPCKRRGTQLIVPSTRRLAIEATSSFIAVGNCEIFKTRATTCKSVPLSWLA